MSGIPTTVCFPMMQSLSRSAQIPRRALTFGVLMIDLDLDGWVDLFNVNGHVEPEINKVQSSQEYAQPPQLF